MKMYQLFIAITLIVALVSAIPVSAQDGIDESACSNLVQAAIDSTRTVCDRTQRNQACYGNNPIDAQPKPGAAGFVFDNVGDHAVLGDLQTLRLSSLDVVAAQWGIALMEIQANIPDSFPENVTMLLFGDVEISDVADVPNVILSAKALSDTRVYLAPALDSTGISLLHRNDALSATGRTAEADWVLISNGAGVEGWLPARLVQADGDIKTLTVSDPFLPETPHYGAMQAFTFRSGVDDSPCEAAPDSGLMIQTPEGVGQVRMLVNEVVVNVGSTVKFSGDTDNGMLVETLQGLAMIIVNGEVTFVPNGAQVTVPVEQVGDEIVVSGGTVNVEVSDVTKVSSNLSIVGLMPNEITLTDLNQLAADYPGIDPLQLTIDFYKGDVDVNLLTPDQLTVLGTVVLGKNTIVGLTPDQIRVLLGGKKAEVDLVVQQIIQQQQQIPAPSGVGGAALPG